MRSQKTMMQPTRPSLGEGLRLEEGTEIGTRARSTFPGGSLVETTDLSDATRRTRALMRDLSTSTLYEATFVSGGFAAKADVLRRKGNNWQMFEVKASVRDKPEFLDDMAYTALVADLSGVEISKLSLMLVSRSFRLGMGNQQLFTEVEHTKEVLTRVGELKPIIKDLDGITRSTAKPTPQLKFECRDCDLFSECTGKGIENHIFDLPRLSKNRFDELVAMGITLIEDIPPNFAMTEMQKRVRTCVLSGRPYVGKRLKTDLGEIAWPAYYLDFETVQTALPLYPGIAPYTQLPTQYSIHKCAAPGRVIDHMEYLADPTIDCRKQLAERLVKDLAKRGSIIVYSGFENRVIRGLAAHHPSLSSRLLSLRERIVDLEAIIKHNFYHPGFHGSTSIKKTLPALVPSMSYKDLTIGEGDTAAAAFAYLARGQYNKDEAKKVKRNLLKYCKQDTLAMVKLHEALAGQ